MRLRNKTYRTLKHTQTQLKEIDYWNKLSPKEIEYLHQFFLEFYQADFSFKEHSLHPTHLRKDCQERNNLAKRQIHSVGSNLLFESIRRAQGPMKANLRCRVYDPIIYADNAEHVPIMEVYDDEAI